MIKTYSDNAIMAKVRALYGKRLTANDYEQLLAKKSVSELAAYLKKETYYGENLQEVKEDLIHRGQLEDLVRRRVLNSYLSLMKYSYQETLFFRMYVMQSEVRQLLMFIRLINSGSTAKYIVTLPVYLAKHMSFDLFALADVRSYDDLLSVLERSPYYRIVAHFRPKGALHLIDITACECAMLTFYYETMLEQTAREYSGDTRASLQTLLYQQVNLHNISVIYRMRRYLKVPREMIEARVVRIEGADNRLIDRLLEAPDLQAVQDLLTKARALRGSAIDWNAPVRELSNQMEDSRVHICQKLFRFSRHPVVVVVSYMTLLEEEISDIVSITEGIRYGVPPAEIKKLLVL